MLPWWAGLLLALISFIGFHSVAQIEIAPPSQPVELGHNISRQLFKTFASILQYVFPAVLCLGAAGSFFSRRKRRKLFDQIHYEEATLTQLSWKEFELLVGEAFRQRGYAVVETGDGADGGIDLVMTKNGERVLVQCKHWKSTKVTVMVIRELLGVMTSQRAKAGFVVTSGSFTREAESFARRNGITLIGRDELHRMIQSVRSNIQTHRNLKSPSDTTTDAKSLESATPASPACPACKADMILRTAARGNNPGSKFWGCSRFPKYRATLTMAHHSNTDADSRVTNHPC